MDWDWITVTATEAFMVLLSAFGIYLVLLALTRLSGLRSFSKISGFDFPLTVAVGSILASVILLEDPPLFRGVVALGAVFLLQYTVSRLRRGSRRLEHAVDNEPLLLMAGPEVLHDHLAQVRMTLDDLREKLREAGVTNLDQVRAVVMETTGDVTVLQARDEAPFELDLLSGVRGQERLHDIPNTVRTRRLG